MIIIYKNKNDNTKLSRVPPSDTRDCKLDIMEDKVAKLTRHGSTDPFAIFPINYLPEIIFGGIVGQAITL